MLCRTMQRVEVALPNNKLKTIGGQQHWVKWLTLRPPQPHPEAHVEFWLVGAKVLHIHRRQRGKIWAADHARFRSVATLGAPWLI